MKAPGGAISSQRERVLHADCPGCSCCGSDSVPHDGVQRPGAAESAVRRRLVGYRRAAQAPLRFDSQHRRDGERLRGARKRHVRSRRGRPKPSHDRAGSSRQRRGRGHVGRRAAASLRAGRSVSAIARRRELHAIAEHAQSDRGYAPECAAVLQRRRPRLQYEDRAVPLQHRRRDGSFQGAGILPDQRSRRTRSAQGQLRRNRRIAAMGSPQSSAEDRTGPAAWPRLRRSAAVLAVLVVSLAASASARQLKIQKFSAEIFVQPDSALDVTETIEANFIGEWHGLYRTIPIEYVTPQGFNYTLFVKLESATDAAGHPLKVESSRERHYLKWKIYVDDATDAVRTIILHYRVTNGLKFFEDHDELYWNVTGDEWDVPVGNASAQIFLPPGVTGIRTSEFTGSYGSRAQNA